ncbi:hypothetical protein DUNSADRAFT_8798 [Dunaliella salina]|nr:hypothetical protein DUNSADRAFT_8798 [Dunaliella salina]|eukprot:KAF5834506.1 hypothetical protein DUNSADRAFT_8798 [Dunaliella salina]
MEGIELGSPGALTKHYEAAHMDAQAAIDLDPTYIKAHQRKIQALWKLGKLQEALLAGSRAPKQHNKELGGLLKTIQAELEKESSKAQQSPSKKGPLISVISESPAST